MTIRMQERDSFVTDCLVASMLQASVMRLTCARLNYNNVPIDDIGDRFASSAIAGERGAHCSYKQDTGVRSLQRSNILDVLPFPFSARPSAKPPRPPYVPGTRLVRAAVPGGVKRFLNGF
jgi:hypothetical protein